MMKMLMKKIYNVKLYELMIKLSNVSKFFGEQQAVSDVNLDIPDNTCFGLLWRNGAWKSTTMKMMVWLLYPSAWSIIYDWLDFFENSLQIKQKLSYIPDSPYIYNKLTWMDFMYFMWYTYWLDKQTIMEKSYNFFELFDIKEVKNEKIENYSYGMKQKLAFSAAFLHKPKYLILDEPMVGLDVQSANVIKDIIRSITKKWSTVIITTHQIHVASQICDQVWIIHNWQLKSLIKNKSQTQTLEEKFLEVTWKKDVDYLKRIDQ